MIDTMAELYARRDLLYVIAWREIKVKYKQSIMGMLWAVLMPLVIVGSGFVVRLALSKVSGKPLELSDLTSVAVKAAPWAFFVSALRFGTTSLVNNFQLVTKIYLPRMIFPLAAVLSQLLDFLVASCVLAVFLVVAQAGWSVQILWLPLLVVTLVVMAASLAIIFAAASLFLRDVKFIVEVFLTFAIFFTPVFYDSSILGNWAPLLLVNPVSPLIEGIASTLILHQAPSLPWLAYSVGCAAVLSAIAISMFKRLEPLFAESI